MKTSHLLNLLLAVAVVILSVKTALFGAGSDDKDTADGKAAENAVIDNIMTRTSVRAYQDRDVEEEKVETMLRAAMAAPSAGNKQPWKFVVVRDRDILHEISANLHTMRMAEHAPLAIVVCGDMENTFPEDGRDYWVEDASAATENLLLAAHGLGLGAVWCGIYPMGKRVAFLQELLRLPEHIVPLNVIPIGYPAEAPAPKDKWKPENVHYERWGGKSAATSAAVSAATPSAVPSASVASAVPSSAAPSFAAAEGTGAAAERAAARAWRKVQPAELRENPFRLFGDALALAVGDERKMNAMTIGWGGLGVLWGRERPVVTVYVEKRRHTHSFMEENEYFTVTAFPKEKRYDDALRYLGTVSGRDEDKMKGSGLEVRFTESGCPAFEEGRLILECKKIYGAPFDPEGFGELAKREYSDRPLHSVYIGEIVNAWMKE